MTRGRTAAAARAIFGSGAIAGSGGGGKGGGAAPVRAAQEAPNTLRSKATARVIDLLGAGEIVGLVDPATGAALASDAYGKGVIYNDTTVQNADSSFNFSGVTLDHRAGTPDQSYMAGFPETEAETAVGVKVVQATPVIRTITNVNANAARVTLRLPSLLAQNTVNGDLNGTAVAIEIAVKPNGGSYATAVSDTISGKTTSPYERAYRIALTGSGPWDVKVTRVTADSASVALQNETWWSSLTEIVDYRLAYPGMALVAHAVDSQMFGGSIPTRGYEVKGLKIKVPDNYDPATRVYTGLWGGDFQVAWTDNPAWIFRYLLTDPDNGLGGFVDESQVDDETLYAIAQYCDALVPDGFGGTEPRFTWNGVINSRGEAYGVLQAIAASFRGMGYWLSGAVTATQDAPADPVAVVAPANTLNGIIAYQGSSLKARPTAVLVTWNDPADGYRAAIEVVECDADLIRRFGWRPADVTAAGCTSRGQARRLGKWILDEAWNETETATYTAGLDHAFVRPGDIVAIADPAVAGVRHGGRIAAATTTSITIDQAVSLAAGETYTVSIVQADGTIADRPLTNAAGAATVLTWSSALAAAPAVNAMWALTGTDAAPRLFRVLALVETEKHQVEVTALLHDPDKYARIEQDVRFDPTPYSVLPTGAVAAPSGVTVSERLYLDGGILRNAATISWQAAADARVVRYEVEARAPAEAQFAPVGETPTLSFDMLQAADGEWGFRVRAVDGVGRRSAWASLDPVVLQALAVAIADVTGFRIQIIGNVATLSWDPSTSLNLDHYALRFAPVTSGATWAGSLDLLPPIAGTSVQVAAMAGTYLIKGVGVLGNESPNAALIVSTIGGIDGLNAVATVAESPDFAGVKTDCAAIDGALQLGGADMLADWPALADVPALTYGLAGVAPSGTYEFAGSLDLGAVYTSRLTATLAVAGINIFDVMAGWTTLAGVDPIAGPLQTAWTATLQVRTTDDDPGGSPTWSDWQTFLVGDYTARGFEWRLLLTSTDPAVTPLVSQLVVTVDMPDRVARGEDVLVPEGGLTIVFDPAFKATPAIHPIPQSVQTGDTWNVTGQSAGGFTVAFKDSLGADAARTMDWIAVGYGYERAA